MFEGAKFAPPGKGYRMEDNRIVDLYWQRNENAISETASKYGGYLNSISYQILSNSEDAEECVNDTYIDAWNCIPPHRPSILSTFLGKITRRISIDLFRKRSAGKRGGGETDLALDELEECVAGNSSVEAEIERKELQKTVNEFLAGLPTVERQVFMRRYWYMDSVQTIAEEFGFSESKTASMLFRIRGKLKARLGEEGC